MKNKLKKESGVTLIALIITVIILLILAGVTIASLGNSGLFSKSKDAVNKYANAEKNESERLNEYINELDNWKDPDTIPAGYIPIYTKEDFQKIGSNEYNYNIKGINYDMLNNSKYIIMNNIDLDNIELNQIYSFQGELYGNNKELDNMKLTNSYIVFMEDNSLIRNLKVKVKVDEDNFGDNFGVFANQNKGIISNCEIYGEIKLKLNSYNAIGSFTANTRGSIINSKNYANIMVDAYDPISPIAKRIGGISGDLSGKIENCSNYGKINVKNDIAGTGGIVGFVENNGTIIKSGNFGEIHGIDSQTVGGIAGRNKGRVEKSFNRANITNVKDKYINNMETAGLVGMNYDNGSIAECFNEGNITVEDMNAEGLIGTNAGQAYMENCYNVGKLSGTGEFYGITRQSQGNKIKNVYNYGEVNTADADKVWNIMWNIHTIAEPIENIYYIKNSDKNFEPGWELGEIINVKELSLEEFKQKTSFVGFDFDTVWKLEEGDLYPKLRAFE